MTTPPSHAKASLRREHRTAAIYCRVSSKKQAAEEKSSLSTQDRLCRAKARELGVIVDEDFVRHDTESASDPDARSNFDWLMQQADRHAFDVLIVDIIDRLTRGGMADFFTLYDRLHRAGVALETATEQFDPSDEGQMMAGMRAYIAKKENDDRVRRSVRGKIGFVERGHPLPGGTVLYGYRWVDEAKTQRRKDDDDSEARCTVERIWRYYLTDPNPTLTALAKQLREDGVRSPRAYFSVKGALNRWTTETLRQLLWNPVYWGGDEDGMITTFNDSKHVETPMRVPTNAPPYVTREEAARVHARLRENERIAPRNRKREWAVLLNGGLARCAECGWALQPYEYKRVRADGTCLIVYRCQKRAMLGRKACGGVSISAEVLDFATILAINEHLGRGDYLRRVFAAWDRDAATASARVHDIHRQILAIQKKIDNAAAYITEHGMDDPLAPSIAAHARLARESLPALHTRLHKAQEAVATACHNPALRDELEAWFAAWTMGFQELDLTRQRTFLQALGAEVKLWRLGERTPRARLALAVPVSPASLPAPLDVEASVAAYGALAEVDDEGIYIDIERGAKVAAGARDPLVLDSVERAAATERADAVASDVIEWLEEELEKQHTDSPIAPRTRGLPGCDRRASARNTPGTAAAMRIVR